MSSRLLNVDPQTGARETFQVRTTSFLDRMSNAFMNDTLVGTALDRVATGALPGFYTFRNEVIYGVGVTRTPGFDPLSKENLLGYEEFANELADVNSPEELSRTKLLIDRRLRRERELEFADAGWSRFLGNLVDPINFVPVPMAKGLGIFSGARAGAMAGAATFVPAEAARIGLSPTNNEGELLYTIPTALAFGAAMGGGLGALAGRYGRSPHAIAQDERVADIARRYHEGQQRAGNVADARPAQPDETVFYTERAGSEYKVFPDGTTQRNKKESGGIHRGDFGLKERSVKTVYLAEEDAQRISGIYAEGQYKESVRFENGKLIFSTWNITREAPTPDQIARNMPGRVKDATPVEIEIPFKAEPEVGAHPLEIGQNWRHLGTKITSVTKKTFKPGDDFTVDPATQGPRAPRHLPDDEVLPGGERVSPDLERIKATGVGLEKLRLRNLPWQFIKNTMVKGALGGELRRLADRISGSPGLHTVGSWGGTTTVAQSTVAKSAIHRVTQMHLIDSINEAYYAYRNVPVRGMFVGKVLDAKERAGLFYDKLRGQEVERVRRDASYDIVEPGVDGGAPTRRRVVMSRMAPEAQQPRPMTQGEFYQAVYEDVTHMRSGRGRSDIQQVRDAADAYEQYARYWQDQINETNALPTGRVRLERIAAEIDEINNFVARIERGDFADSDLANIVVVDPPEIRLVDDIPGSTSGAHIRYDENVIYVNEARLREQFDQRRWMEPDAVQRRLDANNGVDPLEGRLNTFEEFYDFALRHEVTHSRFRQMPGETNLDYEARINRIALDPARYGDVFQRSTGIDLLRRTVQNQLDDLTREKAGLEQLSDAALDAEMKAPGDEIYIHRIWTDAVREHRELLVDVLRRWYEENPHGLGADVITRPEVEARMRADLERLDEIINNQGNRTPGRNPSLTEVIRGWQDYVDTLAELSPELRDFLKRIDMRTNMTVRQYRSAVKARYERLLDNNLPVEERVELTVARLAGDIDEDFRWGGDGMWKPKPLARRRLDIPNERLVNVPNPRGGFVSFIEDDIGEIARTYGMRMGPIVEMAREFGDYRLDGEFARLRMRHYNQLLDARTMDEFTGQVKAFDETIEAAVDLRDAVLGQMHVSNDPMSQTARWAHRARQMTNTVFLGKAGLAAIGDTGIMMLNLGVGPVMKQMIARVASNDPLIKLAAADMKKLGQGYEQYHALRLSGLTDTGTRMHQSNMVDRFLSGANELLFTLNLLQPWTDFAKGVAGSMIVDGILRAAEAVHLGRATAEQMRSLAKVGISAQDAVEIYYAWQAAGAHGAGTVDRLYVANIDQWTPGTNALRKLAAALDTDVNNCVITPGVSDIPNIMRGVAYSGERPHFVNSEVWKVILQFKRFPMSATYRASMTALQRKDRQTMNAIMAGLAIGYFIDFVKSPDFDNRPFWDPSRFVRAVDLSGFGGIFMEMNNVIEGASANQIGIRPALGIDPFEKHPNWATQSSAVLGPFSSIPANLTWAFTSPEAQANDRASALRYTIPMNNVWWWSGAFQRIQRDLSSAME